MDILLIGLRLVHVVSAVIWVGMVFFTVYFLAPAIQEVGPEGGKVMGALARRGLLNFVPVIGLLTVLSGLWLYWRTSLGLQPAYVHSATGGTFALGGLSAITAFVIGMTVMRPAMLGAMRIMQTVGGIADESRRQAAMAEAQRLRVRGGKAGRAIAALLLFSAATMAVARYL